MSRRIPRDSNTLKLAELIRTIKVVSYIPVKRFPPFWNVGLFSPEYSTLKYNLKSFIFQYGNTTFLFYKKIFLK